MTNRDSYNSNTITNWYGSFVGLMPGEKVFFERIFLEIKPQAILDIGIGAGRTTEILISQCQKYVGIDYAESLVKRARQKYPDADLRCMDASDLKEFENRTFDAVIFSFNGIDYSDLVHRIRIFDEIYRVLKPGGVFFFSTHNKNAYNFNKAPWLDARNGIMVNLKTFIKLLPYLPKHYKMKPKEIINDYYAIINNCAHNYALMTFHSTPEFILSQLNNSGFRDIEFHDKNGNAVSKDCREEWIFVYCRK